MEIIEDFGFNEGLPDLDKLANKAAQNGDWKAVISLIEKGARPDVDMGPDHISVLHFAAQANAKTMFLILHKSKLFIPPVDVNIEDSGGYTPLHWAARTHDVAIIYQLLKSGANINYLNSLEQTPLHIAIDEQNVEMSIYLVLKAGADVSVIENEEQIRFLKQALVRYEPSFATIEGLPYPSTIDLMDEQAFFDAIFKGHSAILQLYLEKNPTLLHSQNKDGLSAMHLATLLNQTEIIQILLKNGMVPDGKTQQLVTIYPVSEDARDLITKNSHFHVFELGAGDYEKASRLAQTMKQKDHSSQFVYTATEILPISKVHQQKNAEKISELGFGVQSGVDAYKLAETGKPDEKADVILWQSPHPGNTVNMEDDEDMESAKRIATKTVEGVLQSAHDKVKRKQFGEDTVVSGKVMLVFAVWPYKPTQQFGDKEGKDGIPVPEIAKNCGWKFESITPIPEYGLMKTYNGQWMDVKNVWIVTFVESEEYLLKQGKTSVLFFDKAQQASEMKKDAELSTLLIKQLSDPGVIFGDRKQNTQSSTITPPLHPPPKPSTIGQIPPLQEQRTEGTISKKPRLITPISSASKWQSQQFGHHSPHISSSSSHIPLPQTTPTILPSPQERKEDKKTKEVKEPEKKETQKPPYRGFGFQ